MPTVPVGFQTSARDIIAQRSVASSSHRSCMTLLRRNQCEAIPSRFARNGRTPTVLSSVGIDVAIVLNLPIRCVKRGT
jgi:hypothetical protein